MPGTFEMTMKQEAEISETRVNAKERVRVMIVEDHFVVRAGLTAIINSQPDMLTVAEARNGREAIDLFREQ